jgi:hypothetical protein
MGRFERRHDGISQGFRHPFLHAVRLVIFVLVLTCMSSASVGQDEPTPQVVVNIGFDGHYRPGLYLPLTINLGWSETIDEPARAELPVNGEVEIGVGQDMVYRTVTIAPLVVHKGVQTRTTVYIRSNDLDSGLTVRVFDDRRHLIAESRPAGLSIVQFEPDYSMALPENSLLILTIGQESLSRTDWKWVPRAEHTLKFVRVSSANFPTELIGLEAVSMIVLGDTGVEPLTGRQTTVLRDWVDRGGHLVIVAGNDLATMDRVFPPQEMDWIVHDLSPATTDADFAEQLRESIDAISATEVDDLERYLDDFGDLNSALEHAYETPAGEVVRPGIRNHPTDLIPLALVSATRFLTEQTLPRRTIAFGPILKELGWSARWVAPPPPFPDSPESVEPSPSVGDMVSGPYGLGKITILGFEPLTLVREGSRQHPEIRDAAIALAWWHCLRPVSELGGLVVGTYDEQQWGIYQEYLNITQFARDISESRTAMNAIIEDLCADNATDSNAFGAILVGLLVLVIFLGPIDWFFFKLIRRQPWSWASSIVWVVLACVGIYLVQDVVGRASTEISQVSLIDVAPGQSHSYATTVTQIASDHNAWYNINCDYRDLWLSPVSYERLGDYGFSSSYETMTTARITRSPMKRDKPNLRMRVPIETARWFTGRGFINPPNVSVRVSSEPQRSSYTVSAGLPDGATVTSILVDYEGETYEADLMSPEDLSQRLTSSGVTVRRSVELEGGEFRRDHFAGLIPIERGWRLRRQSRMDSEERQWRDLSVALLPWEHQLDDSRRPRVINYFETYGHHTFDSIADSPAGSWAIVTLTVRGLPTGMKIRGYESRPMEHLAFIRFIVPVSVNDEPENARSTPNPDPSDTR